MLKHLVSVLVWSGQFQVSASFCPWSFLSKDSALRSIQATLPMPRVYDTLILVWIPNETLHLNNCNGASRPSVCALTDVPSIKEYLSPSLTNMLNLWCYHLEGIRFLLQILADLCIAVISSSRINFSDFRSWISNLGSLLSPTVNILTKTADCGFTKLSWFSGHSNNSLVFIALKIHSPWKWDLLMHTQLLTQEWTKNELLLCKNQICSPGGQSQFNMLRMYPNFLFGYSRTSKLTCSDFDSQYAMLHQNLYQFF